MLGSQPHSCGQGQVTSALRASRVQRGQWHHQLPELRWGPAELLGKQHLAPVTMDTSASVTQCPEVTLLTRPCLLVSSWLQEVAISNHFLHSLSPLHKPTFRSLARQGPLRTLESHLVSTLLPLATKGSTHFLKGRSYQSRKLSEMHGRQEFIKKKKAWILSYNFWIRDRLTLSCSVGKAPMPTLVV